MDKTGIFLIQGKETVVAGNGTQLTLQGGPVEYMPALVLETPCMNIKRYDPSTGKTTIINK